MEEGVVGGLVRAIVPSFPAQFTGNIPLDNINQDLETKKEYDKYCYLCQGIELVEAVGIENAIGMYSENPSNFITTLAEYTPGKHEISEGKMNTN